ncbi:prepilin peptidase [Rothia nasimurium]|uniref:prepilin peptidase n=1 Tax=Rothia nasimurium TaxID=85336 RepID=UPI003BA12BCC
MLELLLDLIQDGRAGSWQAALASALLGWVLAYYLVCAGRLWRIDVKEHRLPDRIVLPMYLLVGFPLLGIILLTSENSLAHARETAYSAVLMMGVYWIMRKASRGALGLGDVKLAGVLGLLLGFISPLNLLWGNLLIFLAGGLTALVLVLTRKASFNTHLAFGPFMLLGTTIALFLPA